MKICITTPAEENIEEIEFLFQKTITQAFKDEGIYESCGNELVTECKEKNKYLMQFFDSKGKDIYFFIAKIDKKIVGIISYSTIANNKEIEECIPNIDFSITPEISSVYILPEYQGKGIGSALVSKILEKLKHENFTQFCLDCGYKKSQKYWEYKFGKPTVICKNFFGENQDYKIWLKKNYL